jgi:hypothetical protein
MKTMAPRGVIYAVAPSPKDINTIWCGSNDGLIEVTHDGGKNWNDVTPPELTSWSKVSIIDAGHFDVQTVYAAVNRIRCDDMHPYIYRSHDGGKTWQKIITGVPDDPINTVREDPKQKGLLFAGSETAVYVSFDDGGHWQPLRLNMPASSIRDLIVKDDDIVVATHGRAFWILDDITPLRQLVNPGLTAEATLFKPEKAMRVRWDMNPDTPLPPDEPAGQNPPDGAIIDYYLKNSSNNEVTLEILDAAGNSIRKYSSNDKPCAIPAVDIPLYWVRPQQILSAAAGPHRFMWDMHYTPLEGPPSFPIAAVYKNTAPDPTSPWVMPGNYTIKLTVNGKAYTQTLTVQMDPRVKTPIAGLQQQSDLSLLCYNGRKTCLKILKEISDLRTVLQKQLAGEQGGKADTLKKLDSEAEQLANKPQKDKQSFDKLNNDFTDLFGNLQAADVSPTTQTIGAVKRTQSELESLQKEWEALKRIKF